MEDPNSAEEIHQIANAVNMQLSEFFDTHILFGRICETSTFMAATSQMNPADKILIENSILAAANQIKIQRALGEN